MAVSNPGLSHFHIPKGKDPCYIPLENAVCKSQISDRQHWIVLMGKP